MMKNLIKSRNENCDRFVFPAQDVRKRMRTWNSEILHHTKAAHRRYLFMCHSKDNFNWAPEPRDNRKPDDLFMLLDVGVSTFRLSQQLLEFKMLSVFCFPPLSFQSALFPNHHVNGIFSPLSQDKNSQLKGLRLLNVARPRQREDLLS